MKPLVGVGLIAGMLLSASAVRPEARRHSTQGLQVRLGLLPEASRALAFEHANAAADLTWLKLVQYLGSEQISQDDWDAVEDFGEIATDLDPKHFVIYEAVATLMSVMAQRPMTSDRFSFKGLAFLPDAWRLYFLVAYNAFFVDDEPYFASRWMALAAERDGAPHYLAALATRMLFQGGASSGALSMLDQLELMAPNDRVLDQLAERRRMILTEQRFARFDTLCRLHKLRLGVMPTNPAEAIALDFSMDAPFDFFGTTAYYDPQCITRSPLYEIRDDDNLALTQRHRRMSRTSRK